MAKRRSLTIALLALMILGFLCLSWRMKASSPELSARLTPTPAPSPSGEIREPSGTAVEWNTYTNAQYGYTIRYPANWNVREWDNSGSPSTIIQHIAEFGAGEGLLQVNVWSKPAEEPLASWLTHMLKRVGGARGRIQLPEAPNYEVADSPTFTAYVDGMNPARVFIFAKGAWVYEVYAFSEKGAEASILSETIYGQMLSTFELAE